LTIPPYVPVVDPYPDPPPINHALLLAVTPDSIPYDFADDRGHDTDVKVYATTDLTVDTISVQTYVQALSTIIPVMWKEDENNINQTYNILTELAVNLGGGEWGFEWTNLKYLVPTIYNASFDIFGKFENYAPLKIVTIDTIEVTLVITITDNGSNSYG